MAKAYMSYALLVTLLYLLGIAISEECGEQAEYKSCPNKVCCSKYGWCGYTDDYCSPSKDCQLDCHGPTNVEVARMGFDPEKHNWDLKEAYASCGEWSEFANKPLAWSSKYNWTTFCGPVGPQGRDVCGKCLRVKHTRTGAEIIVRALSLCKNNRIGLTSMVFRALANQSEIIRSRFRGSYEFVDCKDDAVNNLLEVA